VEGGFKGALVLITLSTSACGKVADSASQLASAPLSPAVEIATKSSITGKVMLKGADTTALRKLVDVGGNPFCTGHGEIVDSTWRVSADGALADAVITVRGSQRASNLPEVAPLIDQTKCEFIPHTLAIQPGQNVRFRNSDLTFHNIRIARHEAGTRGKG
jgi:hypothetical protein